jgi:serine/threonine-protein kinase
LNDPTEPYTRRARSAPLPLASDRHNDLIADRFEDAWKARPQIEAYLAEAPEHSSRLLKELLRLDVEYRRRRGEHPTLQDYVLRFPGEIEAIHAAFAEALQARPSNETRRFHKIREFPEPGGIGKLFVAMDLELNLEVILKEIRDEFADDAESRKRFQLEAQITAMLEHPGIVPVYGMGQYANGRPYYAMRFLKRGNLETAIRRFHEVGTQHREAEETILSQRQLLTRFVAACNAVAYAHSRGVIHRDLKPANILLGKYGETLVGDWGLAKVVGRPELPQSNDDPTVRPHGGHGSPTVQGAIMGTAAYMSPEQARGEASLASDIYSLGATLYELLTGRAPVQGASTDEILDKVKRGDWLPPHELRRQTPAALDAICCQAMRLQPEERYATALELANDVERWLADEPVKAYCEPYSKAAQRWMRKHRSGVITSVARALLLAHREAEQRRKDVPPQEITNDIRRKYYAGLSESAQWEQHALPPRRKHMLQMALALYQEFMQEERVMLSELRLANLYQAECGHAYLRIADVYSTIGQPDKAEQAYQDAVAIFGQLVKESPEIADHQKDLGASYNNLALLYGETGRKDLALERLHDALAVQKKLARAHAATPQYQEDLAGTFNNLSLLYSDTGRHEQAEDLYQTEILAIREHLAQTHPNVLAYAVDLGECYCNLGHLAGAAGSPREARQWFERALQTLRSVLQQEPQQVSAGRFLFHALWGRAEALTRTRQHVRAMADWDQAIQLAATVVDVQPPVRRALELGRALILARLGAHAKATTAARALAKGSSLSEKELHRLACIYAQASAAARKDVKLPLAERNKLANRYSVIAVRALQKLASGDAANDPIRRESLADKDLDPVRARRDFQGLCVGMPSKVRAE